jgi:hypothetical protein
VSGIAILGLVIWGLLFIVSVIALASDAWNAYDDYRERKFFASITTPTKEKTE